MILQLIQKTALGRPLAISSVLITNTLTLEKLYSSSGKERQPSALSHISPFIWKPRAILEETEQCFLKSLV